MQTKPTKAEKKIVRDFFKDEIMETRNTVRKVKNIKAWAVVHKEFIDTAEILGQHGIEYVIAEGVFQRKEHAKTRHGWIHKKGDYKIIPCTITYKLPKKK